MVASFGDDLAKIIDEQGQGLKLLYVDADKICPVDAFNSAAHISCLPAGVFQHRMIVSVFHHQASTACLALDGLRTVTHIVGLFPISAFAAPLLSIYASAWAGDMSAGNG
ncbi:hypothetical protein [Sphingobium limneticum]|uniref:hypothetical protein n=1 Tax=Sphingobium limneticum TaxID=1007511 RepID=UPI001B85F466|nr:hypothetical protein [Sphingobium limneticum]